MTDKKMVLPALDGETEEEYDLRNRENKENKCSHSYAGQDNYKKQFCNYCGCMRFNSEVNERYDVYFDDYL